MNHTQIIQQLIDENGYESYLEIGYGTGANFNAINVKNKIAVDPMPTSNWQHAGTKDGHFYNSDEYFEQLDGRKRFDIVFIDGLHHADQVERDIINSMKHLKKGGVIVVHDINPDTIEMQEVPRKTKQWTGDVWRAWIGFKWGYPEVLTRTYLEDFGIGLIYHTKEEILPGFSTIIPVEDFFADKLTLLDANDYEKLFNE